MSEKVVEILNAKECETVVRNALKLSPDESTKIVSYALEKGSNELVGFMGEYFKLRVQIADEQSPEGTRELCCFVKSVPLSNELQRAECERKSFFRKEICAYTAILPNIQKYATTKLSAECYYTRGDLLVLEDLFAAHLGYRHLASDEPYTSRHIKLFLTHLAQLHAGSIAWEEKEGVNIGKQFGDSLFELMLIAENEWYVTGAKLFYEDKGLPLCFQNGFWQVTVAFSSNKFQSSCPVFDHLLQHLGPYLSNGVLNTS
ncbi:uncharacterized protein LOC120767734 [Bactrocera tryoni]|uniref:uncharacterized protein LOC120767734 n=1 Tax=Bactrocera tryoni TaxID=59916 RepID=UPI001A969DFC|nr:uncharacterized protein LOC120767734 [Bactrocera tryoni]